MKKLILCSLACAFLLSCSRDSDNNESASIVGNWKITKYVVLNGKDKSVLSTENNSGCEANNIYIFNSNNTFSFTLYSDLNGPCSIDETITGTFNYNTSTKSLALVRPQITENSDVYSITSSEMRIVNDYDDFNKDGIQDTELVVFLRQ